MRDQTSPPPAEGTKDQRAVEGADADLVPRDNKAATGQQGHTLDGVLGPRAIHGIPTMVRSQTVSLTMTHRGPLPAPEMFREYESVCPGAADRIIKMAEDEGAHRRSIETKTVDADIALQRRGQTYGLIGFLVVALLGAGLLALGIDIAGYIVLVGNAIVMLGGSIWNRIEETRARKLEERKVKALEDGRKAERADAPPPAAPQQSKHGKGRKKSRRRQ